MWTQNNNHKKLNSFIIISKWHHWNPQWIVNTACRLHCRGRAKWTRENCIPSEALHFFSARLVFPCKIKIVSFVVSRALVRNAMMSRFISETMEWKTSHNREKSVSVSLVLDLLCSSAAHDLEPPQSEPESSLLLCATLLVKNWDKNNFVCLFVLNAWRNC